MNNFKKGQKITYKRRYCKSDISGAFQEYFTKTESATIEWIEKENKKKPYRKIKLNNGEILTADWLLQQLA